MDDFYVKVKKPIITFDIMASIIKARLKIVHTYSYTIKLTNQNKLLYSLEDVNTKLRVWLCEECTRRVTNITCASNVLMLLKKSTYSSHEVSAHKTYISKCHRDSESLRKRIKTRSHMFMWLSTNVLHRKDINQINIYIEERF